MFLTQGHIGKINPVCPGSILTRLLELPTANALLRVPLMQMLFIGSVVSKHCEQLWTPSRCQRGLTLVGSVY